MKLSTQQIHDTLVSIGLRRGDDVLVHAGLRKLGTPEGLVEKEDILQFWVDTLLDFLGPDGTLLAPAYYYDFARHGHEFHIDKSHISKELGALARTVLADPRSLRSAHPTQCLAAIGKRAETYCGGESLNGLGRSSPWYKLCKANAKMLFLGTGLQAMTFVHYIEQHYGVPYNYCKVYPQGVYKNGRRLPGQVCTSVRYLDFKIAPKFQRFQKHLLKVGACRQQKLNEQGVFLVSMQDALKEGVQCLERDLYYFIAEPPTFRSGELPLL